MAWEAWGSGLRQSFQSALYAQLSRLQETIPCLLDLPSYAFDRGEA